jgi:hypothetical protein
VFNDRDAAIPVQTERKLVICRVRACERCSWLLCCGLRTTLRHLHRDRDRTLMLTPTETRYDLWPFLHHALMRTIDQRACGVPGSSFTTSETVAPLRFPSMPCSRADEGGSDADLSDRARSGERACDRRRESGDRCVRRARAHTVHSASGAVARFEAVYSPESVDGPVVFTDYVLVADNARRRRRAAEEAIRYGSGERFSTYDPGKNAINCTGPEIGHGLPFSTRKSWSPLPS